MLSILASFYFGLKGVFIDLYNPGSQIARNYSDIVNWISIGTVIIAIPLLIEKYQKLKAWESKITSMSEDNRQQEWKKAIMPILKQIIIVVVLAVIASIFLSMYWNIPPEVVANYQQYYEGKYMCFNGRFC